MNTVELSGKVYRPKLRFTPNGAAVWEASIGVSRKVKDEWNTEYFDLIAFGKTAEELAELLPDKTPVSKVHGGLLVGIRFLPMGKIHFWLREWGQEGTLSYTPNRPRT